MKIMKYGKLAILLVLVLALAGCRKARKGAQIDPDFPSDAVPTDVRIVNRANANRLQAGSVSSKIKLTLAMGDKEAAVGGTLRMKRDDVVQVTLVAFGLMEVGRLELTPDYFLILDRMNHRYVKKSYDEVAFFQRSGIDFYTFQSLFWNELFLFGNKGQTPEESDFMAAQQGNNILLMDKESGRMMLNFVVNEKDGTVSHTRVSGTQSADTKVMDWTYADFKETEGGLFPARMEMLLNLTSKPITLSFELNNLRQSDGWDTRTRLSDKYQELPLDAILNKIMNLAE